MPCFALKIWRYAESPYLCNVFFIVLDLRLTKDWLSGIDSLFFCLYVYNRYVSLYNISQIAMMCPILPPKQNR